MRYNQKVDPDRLKELHDLGLTNHEIAECFGCSREAVRLWKNRLGLEHLRRPPRRRIDEYKDAMIRDYLYNDMTLEDIEDKYPFTRRTIGRAFRRWGVQYKRSRKFGGGKARQKRYAQKAPIALKKMSRDKLIELYREYGTMQALGDYLGYSRRSIFRAMRYHGINPREVK